jgi:Tfp pilus assembly protein PilV
MDITERQAGFTFNEVLVAMNVIMVAVLGYSLSSVSVIRDQAANDNFTIAITSPKTRSSS